MLMQDAVEKQTGPDLAVRGAKPPALVDVEVSSDR
jgi:hypothetical protein